MIRVAVAGGFDPLHIGHLSHIMEAKKLGDWLIVIVNSDQDMIRKKGYCFMPQDERMEIIETLRYVDEVVPVIDRDGTVVETLAMLHPDIFCKGGDRNPDNMPESEVKMCQEIECRIVYNVGDEKIQSSSGLVEAVRK